MVEEMMTQELLTCPFCGGSGHLEFTEFELCEGFHVVCHGKKDCPLYCSKPYRPFDTEAEAIAMWNTRAQSNTAPQSELDEARALLRSCLSWLPLLDSHEPGSTTDLLCDRIKEALAGKETP
jgi:hypothetical protein